jgi:hypothetical protein
VHPWEKSAPSTEGKWTEDPRTVTGKGERRGVFGEVRVPFLQHFGKIELTVAT